MAACHRQVSTGLCNPESQRLSPCRPFSQMPPAEGCDLLTPLLRLFPYYPLFFISIGFFPQPTFL